MSASYHTEFKAWSCDFILEIIAGPKNPDFIVSEIKATLKTYEKTFSRFLPDSDLSRANRGDSLRLTSLWEEVLKEAERFTNSLSPQYFNPHVNLAAQGYKDSIETLKSTQTLVNVSKIPAFPDGCVIENQQLKLKPGVHLDFGSFLKSFVAAQIADRYAAECQGLIINFGGDITVRGHDTQQPHFEIGIYNPITKSDHCISLQQQSLCTSGTYKRTWETTHGTAHHITNPQSQHSAKSDFVSISFWGQDAALCDAMATAAFNATPREWAQWIKAHPDTHYLAIDKNGHTHVSV